MPGHRLLLKLIALIPIVLLAACGGISPSPNTQNLNQPSIPSATSQLPQTPTFTRTPLPTSTPVSQPETVSHPVVIEPDNAGKVSVTAKMGKGTLLSHPSDAPEGMPIYSPDGKLTAIPTSAGIYIYDTASMTEMHRIQVATPFIGFSKDSSLLAAGGRASVSLWNPATGAHVGDLLGNPESWYWEVIFSPDGLLLSSTSSRSEITVWSLATGEVLFTFHGDRLRFSPDGKLAVVVVYGENQVYLYETLTGTKLNQWNARDGGFAPEGQLWLADEKSVRLVYIDRNLVTAPFRGVQPSFSADGTAMAVFDRGQIWIYDPQKGRRTQVLEGNYVSIDGVLFSPNGQTLAGDVYTLLCPTCTEMDGVDRTLVLWRAADGSIIARIKHPTGWIGYSVDGSSLTALEMESMQVINPIDGSIIKRIAGFTNPVEGMTLSPDGDTLAAVHAGDEYTLRLWDIETGQVEREIQGRESFSVSNVEVSYRPDGRAIAVGGDLWDLTTGEQLTDMEQAVSTVTSCWSSGVAFSPDGDTLATGCFEGQLDLWHFPDGALLKRIDGYQSWVNELAYTPDGKHLAAIYSVPDYLVQVWQIPEGTASFKLTGGHFTRVAYSADGRILATVMANPEYDQYGWPAGSVQIWSASDGKELNRLEIDDAISIAFSPDSRILATGSLDGTLRLWETSSGKLLMESREHYGQIQRLVFTPDGTTLVSGSLDGTILIWGVSTVQ